MDFMGQRGHYGAWRLLCATPAMLTSTVQVIIVSALLGRYAVLGLVGWLLVGVVLLGRQMERATVRVVYRFHRPVGAAAEWLDSLRELAEHRCRVPPGRLDWYVRDDPQPNAFVAGRRSVAVTSGFLQLLRSGRLDRDQAVAVLIHELLTAPVTGLDWFARFGCRVGRAGGSPTGGRVRRSGLCACWADALR